MKLKIFVLLFILTIGVVNFSVRAQTRSEENWRDVEPKTVTLFSRVKYKVENSYDRSAFSFKQGVRSDTGSEITRNNYELEYGNISFEGDNDWFTVTMVTDDCSRIKDLGKLKWSELTDVPLLPANTEPQRGIKLSLTNYEEVSNGQVTKAIAGHLYVLHSKDTESDFYTLFRVEKLVPGDHVTISWKVVPAPGQ